MQINQLKLQNFRNYKDGFLAFSPHTNVIFGENAQGKTNLLEAIVYLSCGRSPRTRRDRELIRFSTNEAKLVGNIHARGRDFKLEAALFRGRRRQLSVNGVKAKNAAALSEVYQTVYFSPEDLLLIRAGAAERRRFMDDALCQLRPRYHAALTEYNRLYAHKTRLLRDYLDDDPIRQTLPVYNEALVICGASIIRYRAQFAKKLSQIAAVHHRECSGRAETLEIQYETVSTVSDPLADKSVIAEQLREHMAAHTEAELAARLCLSGPHKDDLAVTIDGREAKRFASQGQTRTAALSLKLAEREIFKHVTGEYPILLLDDVLSELDQKRQEFVLSRIPGGQVFISACGDDRLPNLLGVKVLTVSGGQIMEDSCTCT